MERIGIRSLCRLSLAVATAVSSSAMAAQTEPDPQLPRLTIAGATGLRSLLEVAGMRLTVDRDAYVVVFALSPARFEAPFQLLSPVSPKASSHLTAGRVYHTTRILPAGVMRLASTNSSANGSTVVVAFVSGVRPNLSKFENGGTWASELVMSDTTDIGPRQFVAAMARELYGDLPYREAFGTDVPYRVEVRQLSTDPPLSRYAGFRSATECLGTFNQLSWSAAIQQASSAGGMAPRPDAVGTGPGCGSYGVDWPVGDLVPRASDAPPRAAATGSPATSSPARVVP